MVVTINQGDILNIERITYPVLVLSKNFFNKSEEILGCPIYRSSSLSPLHVEINSENIDGYAQCEKIQLIDFHVRGFKKIDKITELNRMEISDIVQGIFDYM